MNRLFVCTFFFALATLVIGCGAHKQPGTNESANRSTQPQTVDSTAKPQAAQPATPSQPGDLQPGQASGTYTANGQVVQLKYAYAGHAQRFGTESLVILLTEQPIPAEAVMEELKSTTLLDGEKIRGLEYVVDESSMWVKYHPGQYQESGSNKLKDYKLENDIVRGFDDNDGDLSNGKYARSVKFVAALTK